MPVALVVILLDITLVYHAARTGRLQPWAFIILMVPLIGALAYIVVELIPEWSAPAPSRRAAGSPPSSTRKNNTARCPTGCSMPTPSPTAPRWPPNALERGRFDEAERHYDHIRSQPLGEEPLYALGKAKAQFGAKRPADAVATLDALKEKWPDFESGEGHLLYARALAEAGRVDEALEEYSAVITYFSGAEARVRYGLLLQKAGRNAEARVLFNELLLRMRRAPKHAQNMQAEWLAIAEKELSV